jgi:hypothetical protein
MTATPKKFRNRSSRPTHTPFHTLCLYSTYFSLGGFISKRFYFYMFLKHPEIQLCCIHIFCFCRFLWPFPTVSPKFPQALKQFSYWKWYTAQSYLLISLYFLFYSLLLRRSCSAFLEYPYRLCCADSYYDTEVNLVEGHYCFEEIYCLHLQGWSEPFIF